MAEDKLKQARLLRRRERALLAMCNCAYPIDRYRNGSGHHPECPTHLEVMAQKSSQGNRNV